VPLPEFDLSSHVARHGSLANSGFAADGLCALRSRDFEVVVVYHDFGLARHHLAMV
jgi:hypothetical protein